jgi:RecJ-like exonuclease
MSEIVDCPKCYGRGVVKVLACAGTSTEYTRRQFSEYSQISIDIKCSFCGGKGKVVRMVTYMKLEDK